VKLSGEELGFGFAACNHITIAGAASLTLLDPAYAAYAYRITLSLVVKLAVAYNICQFAVSYDL
jgi:hypothetical protein